MSTPERADNLNADLIRGLRELAEWLEAHPEAPQIITIPTFNVWFHGDNQKFQLIAVAKLIGGRLNKGEWSNGYYLRKEFAGGINMDFNATREQVCERVVTTKTVPERIIAAVAEQVIPAHEEEEVHWKCPDSLLEGEPNVAENR